MKPTQAARTFRKIGPKFSAYLVQQKLSRLLDGRRLSKLDDLGQALVRRMLGDPITVAVDGLKIQGPFDSRWMLYHMKAEIYEPLEVELFKQTVGPEMTVLDVGATSASTRCWRPERWGTEVPSTPSKRLPEMPSISRPTLARMAAAT
jgi:hypothetical protein